MAESIAVCIMGLKKLMNREKLIAIIGPTAVGKTDLSIALARRLGTEIISGDSMLVYRNMNIGTAKPTLGEMAGVKHHLIDILEPNETFSVTKFKELAQALITQINMQGKIPILAGGTGLYVKSLIEDYQFNETAGDNAYRQSLEKLAADHGKEFVHAMLAKVDPANAARLHVNDFRRVIRALEVIEQGGEFISQTRGRQDGPVYDVAVIGLNMERAKLYERINLRVDHMIDQGLVEEVAGLLRQGITLDHLAMKGIGYKELVNYLQGDISLEAAIEQIKQSTRHFAKRQLTWFRKMPYIEWYDVDKLSSTDIMEEIYTRLAGKKFFE